MNRPPCYVCNDLRPEATGADRLPLCPTCAAKDDHMKRTGDVAKVDDLDEWQKRQPVEQPRPRRFGDD
jgi:hypothetical protein